MKKFHESIWRSLTKTITFRFIVICLNIMIVYLITRRVDLTVLLIGSVHVTNTVVYFFHERVWNTVHWGKDHKK